MREPRIPVIGHRPGSDPLPGAVTLPELTAALRRFELRPDLNPDATEDEAARQLSAWSPTLPGPDADEGPYLSCVVLEYGGGEGAPVTPEEASRRWSGRFHLVYSAWSHREAQPRFRLVLPLEHLVPVGAWPRVWAWAVDRAGEGVDRTRPSPAARYPLPAVPDEDAPRVAFSRPGALLDPHAAGLLEAPVAHPAAASGPAGDAASVLRGEEPDARYLDHVDDSAVYFVDEGWDDGGWEDEPWVEAGTAEEPPGPGGRARGGGRGSARGELHHRRRPRPPPRAGLRGLPRSGRAREGEAPRPRSRRAERSAVAPGSDPIGRRVRTPVSTAAGPRRGGRGETTILGYVDFVE
jgi:hypothetical protein